MWIKYSSYEIKNLGLLKINKTLRPVILSSIRRIVQLVCILHTLKCRVNLTAAAYNFFLVNLGSSLVRHRKPACLCSYGRHRQVRV